MKASKKQMKVIDWIKTIKCPIDVHNAIYNTKDESVFRETAYSLRFALMKCFDLYDTPQNKFHWDNVIKDNESWSV